MAAITASMVAELRAKTDAPMMECKKALTEADGNMEKAEEILRVKLGNKASKANSKRAVLSLFLCPVRTRFSSRLQRVAWKKSWPTLKNWIGPTPRRPARCPSN